MREMSVIEQRYNAVLAVLGRPDDDVCMDLALAQ
jgi:hypothetical protein